jgi:serine/threonine protein phosphatase PrpC
MSMEDETVLREEFRVNIAGSGERSFSLYCVFDGHGGRRAAEFSRDFLVEYLIAELGERSCVFRALLCCLLTRGFD